MFGGGGGHSPTPVKQVDQAELDKQQSEAAAAQNTLAGKRKGAGSTRLTDPVVDLSATGGRSRNRVSLLGGGDIASSKS